MNTRGALWVGGRWYEVLLALLPGLFVIASKGGLLRALGGASFPGADFYAVPILCLVLVLVNWLRERRFAVWSFPALGMALAVVLMTLTGLLYLLAPLLHLSGAVSLFLAIAIVWGMLLILLVHYHPGSVVPKAFWILLAASIGAFVLPFIIDISAAQGDQVVESAVMAATVSAIWLGVCLLPVLIVWPLARQHGTRAALVVLGAEFFFYDTISDPGYALRMLTQDPSIPLLVNLLPAIGFLILCPLWAIAAQSPRARMMGFLLPSSLALVVTEVLSCSVRPYFTPDMWFRRGLGAASFIFILALGIVAYRAVQSARLGAKNELPAAEGSV